MDQTKQGCRIRNKQCLCGHGCISEYRYPTLQDCQIALRGKTYYFNNSIFLSQKNIPVLNCMKPKRKHFNHIDVWLQVSLKKVEAGFSSGSVFLFIEDNTVKTKKNCEGQKAALKNFLV